MGWFYCIITFPTLASTCIMQDIYMDPIGHVKRWYLFQVVCFLLLSQRALIASHVSGL